MMCTFYSYFSDDDLSSESENKKSEERTTVPLLSPKKADQPSYGCIEHTPPASCAADGNGTIDANDISLLTLEEDDDYVLPESLVDDFPTDSVATEDEKQPVKPKEGNNQLSTTFPEFPEDSHVPTAEPGVEHEKDGQSIHQAEPRDCHTPLPIHFATMGMVEIEQATSSIVGSGGKRLRESFGEDDKEFSDDDDDDETVCMANGSEKNREVKRRRGQFNWLKSTSGYPASVFRQVDSCSSGHHDGSQIHFPAVSITDRSGCMTDRREQMEKEHQEVSYLCTGTLRSPQQHPALHHKQQHDSKVKTASMSSGQRMVSPENQEKLREYNSREYKSSQRRRRWREKQIFDDDDQDELDALLRLDEWDGTIFPPGGSSTSSHTASHGDDGSTSTATTKHTRSIDERSWAYFPKVLDALPKRPSGSSGIPGRRPDASAASDAARKRASEACPHLVSRKALHKNNACEGYNDSGKKNLASGNHERIPQPNQPAMQLHGQGKNSPVSAPSPGMMTALDATEQPQGFATVPDTTAAQKQEQSPDNDRQHDPTQTMSRKNGQPQCYAGESGARQDTMDNGVQSSSLAKGERCRHENMAERLQDERRRRQQRKASKIGALLKFGGTVRVGPCEAVRLVGQQVTERLLDAAAEDSCSWKNEEEAKGQHSHQNHDNEEQADTSSVLPPKVLVVECHACNHLFHVDATAEVLFCPDCRHFTPLIVESEEEEEDNEGDRTTSLPEAGSTVP